MPAELPRRSFLRTAAAAPLAGATASAAIASPAAADPAADLATPVPAASPEAEGSPSARRRIRFGVNYVPSKNWWFSWADWDRASIARDLDRIAALGMDHIRIMCAGRNCSPTRTTSAPSNSTGSPTCSTWPTATAWTSRSPCSTARSAACCSSRPG
ncbi:hypothetical protein HNR67_008621 [Crossiella cryophila]|uniref:Uncharacterized protein n=1 Tax=Crossiella cryophila TaxID=43355 RepID=A0A7W7CMH0_9PSEU|nr:hypothetical protein [Crossiella cryophila]